MLDLRHKKELVEAETKKEEAIRAKIKEKGKATVEVKSREERIIIATGKAVIGITATFFTGLAVCIALWKVL